MVQIHRQIFQLVGIQFDRGKPLKLVDVFTYLGDSIERSIQHTQLPKTFTKELIYLDDLVRRDVQDENAIESRVHHRHYLVEAQGVGAATARTPLGQTCDISILILLEGTAADLILSNVSRVEVEKTVVGDELLDAFEGGFLFLVCACKRVCCIGAWSLSLSTSAVHIFVINAVRAKFAINLY